MNRSPSELCKAAGLKSLNELSKISGQSVSTLCSWFKNPEKRYVFDAVMEKAARDSVPKTGFTSTPGGSEQDMTALKYSSRRAGKSHLWMSALLNKTDQ